MPALPTANATCFYSLSLDAYSGTPGSTPASHAPTCFYSLSLDAYSGTVVVLSSPDVTPRFYSLSLDAYSGTRTPPSGVRSNNRRGSRFYSLSLDAYSGTALEAIYPNPATRFYSLSLDAYSGTPTPRRWRRVAWFLFAVARRVQRNRVRWIDMLLPTGF